MNPQGTKCASCQQGINAYFKPKGQCYTQCVGGYFTPDPDPTKDPVCTNYTAAKVANCEVTDPSNDACLTCSKSYVFNTTTKVCDKMTVANCADNGKERGQTCYECEPSYVLSSNKCTASSAIANCATYVKNSGQCGLCANGYYLGTEGKSCIQITAKATCKVNSIDSDACLICLDNTYTISLDGKNCFTGRATSHCIASTTTAANSQCAVCEAGYIPVSGQQNCILDTFNLPGCTSVKQATGYYTCASCKAGYNLQNNICMPSQGLSTCSVANCSEYSSYLYDSATCKTCVKLADNEGKYELKENKCVFVQYSALLSFAISAFIGLLILVM